MTNYTSASAVGGAKRRWWWTPLVILIIIVGTFICLAGLVFTVDNMCFQEAQIWIPRYPNAEVISETYTGSRPFGIGETILVLRSPDSVIDVRQFYREVRGLQNPNAATQTLGNPRFQLSEDPEGGTRIILTSACASE